MKQSIFALLIFLSQSVIAQMASDSVSLGTGYANQVFYSFSKGAVHTADNTNWDIGFGISGWMSEIRINDGNGVRLFLYPVDDTAGWDNVDTTGISQWPALFNTDTNWQYTAFNRFMADDYDLGWGVYNPTTHIVEGDSIYIIQLRDGSWRKFKMDRLAGGKYYFTFANIDGTNEIQGVLDKSGFQGKNTGYFSLVNNAVVDREPLSSEWDITFTKYAAEVDSGEYYPVTGALINKHIIAARVANADTGNVHWFGHDYTSSIGIIGYDWKYFDMNTYQYVIKDSLVYFAADTLTGDIRKIIFTGFDGSSTGNIYFKIALAGNTGTDSSEMPLRQTAVYPNPATDFLIIESGSALPPNTAISIMALSGQTVFRTTASGLSPVTIPVSGFTPGVYLIRIASGTDVAVRKVVIE